MKNFKLVKVAGPVSVTDDVLARMGITDPAAAGWTRDDMGMGWLPPPGTIWKDPPKDLPPDAIEGRYIP